MSKELVPATELLLYPAEDGRSRVQVRLQGETVWLTQKLMTGLFQVSVLPAPTTRKSGG